MREHPIRTIVFLSLLAIGSFGQPALAECPASSSDSSSEQIQQCFNNFQEAWRERDMTFIRGFFAHDPEMLLFFERRQLRGWSDVEILYENMFAHALPGSVKSNYSNLDIKANGNMAYVAANFHLQVTNPEGEEMTDEGRVTVVFERREDNWVVVHRHTSFQAPPGPHRPVPRHEGPGPLWDATLEGAWRDDAGATLLATAEFLSARNVAGLPEFTKYRVDEDGIWLIPEADSPTNPSLVETVQLTGSELVLRLPDGVRTFSRAD